jgi:hypothetical protein
MWRAAKIKYYPTTSSGLRSGDDEGTIEFAVTQANNILVDVNVLVSG